MFLSVCIVYYRGTQYIDDCLETLGRALKDLEWELLLFDNEDTKESRETIEYAIAKTNIPNCRIVAESKNIGFGPANNRLAEIASGSHLFLLNQDTRIEAFEIPGSSSLKEDTIYVPLLFNEDRTRQQNEFHYPTKIKVFSQMSTTAESFLRRVIQITRRRFVARSPYLGNETYPSGAALLVPARIFEAAGGFDEYLFMYHEECDFFSRIRKEKKVVVSEYEKIRITHFGNSGRPVRPRLQAESFCNLAYILGKERKNFNIACRLIKLYIYKIKVDKVVSGTIMRKNKKARTTFIYNNNNWPEARIPPDVFYSEMLEHLRKKLELLEKMQQPRFNHS